MRWNRMTKVFCFKSGRVVWANGVKVADKSPLDYRCTFCGEVKGHEVRK